MIWVWTKNMFSIFKKNFFWLLVLYAEASFKKYLIRSNSSLVFPYMLGKNHCAGVKKQSWLHFLCLCFNTWVVALRYSVHYVVKNLVQDIVEGRFYCKLGLLFQLTQRLNWWFNFIKGYLISMHIFIGFNIGISLNVIRRIVIKA